MNETMVTIVGNLTADPELRFTPSGAAVANFTIASTPRVKDGDAWKDGQPLFLNCSIWREAAENATESLKRGCRVIAYGRLKQRSYETRDGEKRTVVELDVEEIGPSLRYARASIEKTSSKPQKPAPAAADDPWGSAPAVGDDGLPPF